MKKNQQLSQHTIDCSGDIILWVDSEGTIHYINQAVYKILGFKPEQIIGRTTYELNPGEDLQFWRDRWNMLKEKKHILFEKYQMNADKQMIPVEVSQNFIEFEGVEYSCSFIRDISERKAAENQIKESEAYYRSLHDNISDLIFILDVTEDCRFKFAGLNPAEEKVLGLKSEGVKGKYIDDIFPAEIFNYIKPNYEKCCKLAEIFAYEEDVTLQDRQKYFFTRLIPIKGEEGKVVRIIGITQDITERKIAEKEIKAALAEVKRLKDQLQDENTYLQQEIKLLNNFDEIITQSPKLKKVLKQVELVSNTDSTVLILGESGTGKELITRAIHNISNRCERPLVKVNCASLHSELIESELFGHEKGAFTGAFEKKIGRFELANGGSIFLDEIGELPINLQAKLLRVLQEGEFERLGNPKTIKVDVRVLAATNRDLLKEIEKGNFREDLYFRLNIFPINLPPLRERKEDIPVLVNHFLKKHSTRIGKQISKVPKKTMGLLMNYNWPGNIRELENIIERAMIISDGNKLQVGEWLHSSNSIASDAFDTLEEMERKHIIKALEKTKWACQRCWRSGCPVGYQLPDPGFPYEEVRNFPPLIFYDIS